MAEKKQELEKRLQDVTGQLGAAATTTKKTPKKGQYHFFKFYFCVVFKKLWQMLLHKWNFKVNMKINF